MDDKSSLRRIAAEERKQRQDWLASAVIPHEPWLRMRLRKLGLAPDAIEDIVHDAYVRLLATERVDHVVDAKRYFLTTARSLVFSRSRRARCVSEEAHDADYFTQLSSSEPGPDVIAEDRCELKRVEKAFGALPERRRRILELRRLERLTCRETAERLSISPSSVEKELRFSIEILAEVLNAA